MKGFDYTSLLTMAAPEGVLVLAALAALFVDLAAARGADRRVRRLLAASLTLVGCGVAGLLLVIVEGGAGAPGGMLALDPLTRLVKLALLALAAAAAWVSVDADSTEHVGEYFGLLLLGTVGLMFLASAENVLMIFVALEMASLSLYVLTAFNKTNPRSAEAALKYFLFGSVAAAMALFGFSLLYGVSGSLELRAVAVALRERGLDPTVAAALVLVVTGFGFKVAVVPFHLWAPDAYQGAPTTSAAFIASSSKVASFFVLAKVLMLGFSGVGGSGGWGQLVPGWIPMLSVLAALSIVLGNLAALTQSSVKRLLAYSAVAHAGYTLVGAASDSLPGMAAVVYYSVTYALAAMGAFAVVSVVEDREGDASLEAFAGLSRRSPLLAGCLLVFLLSLAGIPPLAGFFGKFYLFASALTDGPGYGLLWLVALALAMSTVSLYYYLLVLKQAYVLAPAASAPPVKPSPAFLTAVVALALATVVLGCLPDLLVSRLAAAVASAGL